MSLDDLLASTAWPTIESEASFKAGSRGGLEVADFNFVAFAAGVEVDPGKGQVFVRDVAMALDVGAVINPLAHTGHTEVWSRVSALQ